MPDLTQGSSYVCYAGAAVEQEAMMQEDYLLSGIFCIWARGAKEGVAVGVRRVERWIDRSCRDSLAGHHFRNRVIRNTCSQTGLHAAQEVIQGTPRHTWSCDDWNSQFLVKPHAGQCFCCFLPLFPKLVVLAGLGEQHAGLEFS